MEILIIIATSIYSPIYNIRQPQFNSQILRWTLCCILLLILLRRFSPEKKNTENELDFKSYVYRNPIN